jgi:hypothetical protein
MIIHSTVFEFLHAEDRHAEANDHVFATSQVYGQEFNCCAKNKESVVLLVNIKPQLIDPAERKLV